MPKSARWSSSPGRRVQRSFGGERADVQLVDHRAGHRRAPPAPVRPGERRVVVGPAPAGPDPTAAGGSGGRPAARRRPGGTRNRCRPGRPRPARPRSTIPASSRQHGVASLPATSTSTRPAAGAQTLKTVTCPPEPAAPPAAPRHVGHQQVVAGEDGAGEHVYPAAGRARERHTVSDQPPRPAGRPGAWSLPVTAGPPVSAPPRAKATTWSAAGPTAVTRGVAAREPAQARAPQPQRPGRDQQLGRVQARGADVPAGGEVQAARVEVGQQHQQRGEVDRAPVIRVDQGEPGELAPLVDVGHPRPS